MNSQNHHERTDESCKSFNVLQCQCLKVYWRPENLNKILRSFSAHCVGFCFSPAGFYIRVTVKLKSKTRIKQTTSTLSCRDKTTVYWDLKSNWEIEVMKLKYLLISVSLYSASSCLWAEMGPPYFFQSLRQLWCLRNRCTFFSWTVWFTFTSLCET